MSNPPLRTHAALLAGHVPNPELGNLPSLSQDYLEEERRKIEDYEKMVKRMGGKDLSLSCLHIAAMAGWRQRFQAVVAGEDWAGKGLWLNFAADTEYAELLQELGMVWCHWKRCNEPHNPRVMIELVDLASVFFDKILQDLGVEEFQPNMHPDSLSTKLADLVNATWSRHFDFLAEEGIHASEETTVLCAYLTELRECVASMNPIEGLGVIGAILAILGLNPLDLYGWFLVKQILNLFRQEHGYMEGTYVKTWENREDNEHLATLLQLARQDDYKQLPANDGAVLRDNLSRIYPNAE